jgi:DNA-binding LytR/AlgR family response regulator
MVKKWRVVLIEDELRARENLKALLLTRYLDIDIIAEAESVQQALTIFNSLDNIDGVFLDINLETDGQDAGLNLAFNLTQRVNPPWLIFLTAYEHYAINAHEVHPAAYLLKPLDVNKLQCALDYVRKTYYNKTSVVETPKDEIKIAVRYTTINNYGDKERANCFIKASEVVYVRKNQGANTLLIKLANGHVLDQVAGGLEEWQKKLNQAYFFQIYRGHFINLGYAQTIHKHPFQKQAYQLSFTCCTERLNIGDSFFEQLKTKLQSSY